MQPQVLAVLFLCLVAALPFMWFARFVRTTPYSLAQSFLLLLAATLARFLWRVQIVGEFPVPNDRGAVIICNHRSSVDPFFVQIVLRRIVRWMVAREYCEHPTLRWFLRTAQVIPVNRGGIDTAATKAAIRTVSEAGAVGMFPEGRINSSADFMGSVRPGAIVVALKARAPIVPCYIQGSPYGGTAWSPLMMRANVRVTFGEPIDMSPFYGREREAELVKRLLIQCVQAIASLAGRPEFMPTVAGRRWKPQDSDL